MKEKTRSPLKDRPLRYVAQSVDGAIDDVLLDKILVYYMVACICGMGILNEWMRFFIPRDEAPIMISFIFGITCHFCIYKIYNHIKIIKKQDLKNSPAFSASRVKIVARYRKLTYMMDNSKRALSAFSDE